MAKKDSLIKGTIILAAAALVARFLGIFQRIPLDNLMATQSGVYFNDANNIYLMLLIVATGGIPSAISKMISQRYALGRPDEAQRIYRAALWFGTVTGILVSILLFVFAPYIATHISLEARTGCFDQSHCSRAVIVSRNCDDEGLLSRASDDDGRRDFSNH